MCAEQALAGGYAAIKAGDDAVGDLDCRINFIPCDSEPGMAVGVIPTTDCMGLASWFGRADALADLPD